MAQPSVNEKQFEGEVFFPAPEVVQNAHIQDYESLYRAVAGLVHRHGRIDGIPSFAQDAPACLGGVLTGGNYSAVRDLILARRPAAKRVPAARSGPGERAEQTADPALAET